MNRIVVTVFDRELNLLEEINPANYYDFYDRLATVRLSPDGTQLFWSGTMGVQRLDIASKEITDFVRYTGNMDFAQLLWVLDNDRVLFAPLDGTLRVLNAMADRVDLG